MLVGVAVKPVVNCSANVPAVVGNPLSIRCNVTASADNKPTFSFLLPDQRNMSDGTVLDGGVYSSDVTWVSSRPNERRQGQV
jgi:hypothetical protein